MKALEEGAQSQEQEAFVNGPFYRWTNSEDRIKSQETEGLSIVMGSEWLDGNLEEFSAWKTERGFQESLMDFALVQNSGSLGNSLDMQDDTQKLSWIQRRKKAKAEKKQEKVEKKAKKEKSKLEKTKNADS